MTTSRLRSFAFAVISIFGSVLFVLVAAEVVLRFFPVETSARTMALNAENFVLRAPPNTRFSRSVGSNFRYPNSGRINNDGFFNDQDYSPDRHRPNALPPSVASPTGFPIKAGGRSGPTFPNACA